MANSEAPAALAVAGLGKSFPGVRALDGISFDVPRGAVVGLVGENGAGKSTLIKILSGVYAEYEGEVAFEGRPIRFDSPQDAQRAGIATIFQELTLIPGLSITENVFLGREPTHGPLGIVDKPEMRRRTAEVIARLGVRIDPDELAGDLSIASQQLVEICKAMVLDSRVVIMDEPTSSLTQYEVEQLFGIIRALRAEGRSVIYVSHKLDEIFAICDHVVVMRDGRYVDGYPIGEATTGRIVSDMVGRELSEIYPPHNATVGDVLMRVDGLTRRGEFTNISLEVRAGEVLALAGLIGAGRTELARAVIGATEPEAGTIEVDGVPQRFRDPGAAMAKGIVYLSEDRKGEGLLLDHSIGENIVLSILKRLARFGIVLPGAQTAIIDRGMSELRVKAPNARVAVSSLSGGNQQKVVLARLLATNARVFILDEPTRGVDIGAKAEIYKIIAGLTEAGRGVVLISSELPEVLGLADRVALFRYGKLVRTLARDDANAVAIMNVLTGAAA
jgi:ABC-type sugar transport system ATPase subunit